MNKESPQNEGFAVECAKECGLNDEQIEAVGCMLTFISIRQLTIFVKENWDSDKIEKWVKRYAVKYLKASLISVSRITENRKKLFSKIQDPNEAEQIMQSLRQYYSDCMKADKKDIAKILTPEFLHPDSNI